MIPQTTILGSSKYPSNWKRASLLIRRVAAGHCERCGRTCENLSVHHVGAPFANGTPGNKHDKHDLRRENLQAVCFVCHDELDQLTLVRQKVKARKARHAAKRQAHQALGIGVGLLPLSAFPHIQEVQA